MKKSELLHTLEIVKPGLANNERMEQTTSFAFIDGNVVTYNDEISVSHPVEGLDITGAIQANELYKLLNKIKREEIEITLENDKVNISAGKSKAWFVIQQEIKLPLEEIAEKGRWKVIPSDFIEALNKAVYCCSKQRSDPKLMCVNVNKTFVEASDNIRIMRCVMAQEMPAVKPFLIPASSVHHLIKLKPMKIAEGSGWMHFKTDEGTVISCRILDDEFPDVTQYLKVKGTELTFPKEINEALEKASVFSEDVVKIVLKKKRLSVVSSSETGGFKEISAIDYAGDDICFKVAPPLLKNILSETQTCVYNGSLLKFEGKGWEYVAVLIENSENDDLPF